MEFNAGRVIIKPAFAPTILICTSIVADDALFNVTLYTFSTTEL